MTDYTIAAGDIASHAHTLTPGTDEPTQVRLISAAAATYSVEA